MKQSIPIQNSIDSQRKTAREEEKKKGSTKQPRTTKDGISTYLPNNTCFKCKNVLNSPIKRLVEWTKKKTQLYAA